MFKNKKSKLISALCALAVIAATLFPVQTVYAKEDGVDLKLETGIDKSLEVPLTLKADTKVFYMNGNIDPGDVLKAKIKFENTSKEPVQVQIESITNQLTNDKVATDLLGLLDLKITADKAIIYNGKHSKVTNPVTGWMTIAAGSTMTVDVEISLPKYEVDNTYQAANMDVKWVFQARADVPPDDSKSKTITKTTSKSVSKSSNEIVKTGIEDKDSQNSAIPYIILVAVVLVGGGVCYKVISKKKDEKDNN